MPALTNVRARGVTPLLFSWGGSYTPTATGPTAKPFSKPIPLPSTIAGALYASLDAYSTQARRRPVDIQDLYNLLKSKMGGSDFFIRGPAVLIEDTIFIDVARDKILLNPMCLPPPGYNNCDKDKLFVRYKGLMWLPKYGVGIRLDSRSTVTHLLYAVSYASQHMYDDRGGKEYEIVFDIISYNNPVKGEAVVQLGGDRGLARVTTQTRSVKNLLEVCRAAQELQGSLTRLVCEKIRRLVEEKSQRLKGYSQLLLQAGYTIELITYFIVASPAPMTSCEMSKLINTHETNKCGTDESMTKTFSNLVAKLLEEGRACIGAKVEAALHPPSEEELAELLGRNESSTGPLSGKEPELESNVKRLTLYIDVLNLGYDAALQAPRQLTPAIMPGSIVKLHINIRCRWFKSLEDLVEKTLIAAYISGLAKKESLSRLGWGTIIPLSVDIQIKTLRL